MLQKALVSRPADHPEFFRFPAPEGRSRESTLRIDARGRFWHEERLVEHPGLLAVLHSWISRHPDDGRYILTNGYDWTYFTVEDAPYVVRSLRLEPTRVVLVLSDGSEADWEPESTRMGTEGALYARVKDTAPGGPYEAKFTPHAQTSLAPLLIGVRARVGTGEPDSPAIRIGDRIHVVGGVAGIVGGVAGAPNSPSDR
jgi:uncharacterized protein